MHYLIPGCLNMFGEELSTALLDSTRYIVKVREENKAVWVLTLSVEIL